MPTAEDIEQLDRYAEGVFDDEDDEDYDSYDEEAAMAPGVAAAAAANTGNPYGAGRQRQCWTCVTGFHRNLFVVLVSILILRLMFTPLPPRPYASMQSHRLVCMSFSPFLFTLYVPPRSYARLSFMTYAPHH